MDSAEVAREAVAREAVVMVVGGSEAVEKVWVMREVAEMG